MRRTLTLLALALMLWVLPAQAGEPAGYEALVGDWMPTVFIWDDEDSDTYGYGDWAEETVCVITEDGQIYSNHLEIPISPLQYGEDGQWYVQDDDRDRRISLYLDHYDSLVMSCPDWTVVLLRPDAVSAELPPMESCWSYAGTWELTGLHFPEYYWSPDMILPSFIVEPAALGLPALTVTLGVSPGPVALSQTVCEAVTQQAPGTLLELVTYNGAICGLQNSNTLLVYSNYFMLVMTRTETSEVDEALRPYVQQLAGRWWLDGMSIGGIPASQATPFDADDAFLAIDEAGNALLGDRVVSLSLADGTLLLDGMPLTVEDGGLTLEAVEGVMLYFITEADWYRAHLNGEWRLERIDVPGLYAATVSEDEGVSALLVIGADGTAVLRHDGGEMRFTLQSTDSVTEYILQGEDGDVRILTIVPQEQWYVGVTGGDGAYTHIFVPAE